MSDSYCEGCLARDDLGLGGCVRVWVPWVGGSDDDGDVLVEIPNHPRI